MNFDLIDKEILNTIQQTFPVDARPYRQLGLKAGVSEKEALTRVKELKSRGIIRRIGGVFDSNRLGYLSTLCAAGIPPHKITELTQLSLAIPEITHNYLRDHSYNMWFTIIASSQERLEKIIEEFKAVSGSDQVYSLPAVEVFKIGVHLSIDNREASIENSTDNKEEKTIKGQYKRNNNNKEKSNINITEQDKALIRHLQDDLPICLTPFHIIAEELHTSPETVLSGIRRMLEQRVMRRLGAILYHHKAGFISNGMGVWIVPDEIVSDIGIKMAAFREVSHCYRRPTLPGWPYNLFTMIHGRSDAECLKIMESISRETGIKDYKILFSQKELKKSSMRYFV